jgi:hypothetical protein
MPESLVWLRNAPNTSVSGDAVDKNFTASTCWVTLVMAILKGVVPESDHRRSTQVRCQRETY